jgi:hypothetical protein
MAPPVKPSTVGREIVVGFYIADEATTAGYIAAQSCELKRLAMRAILTTLGYLIEMVELEATETAQTGKAR